MERNIIKIDEAKLKDDLKTLNTMPDENGQLTLEYEKEMNKAKVDVA